MDNFPYQCFNWEEYQNILKCEGDPSIEKVVYVGRIHSELEFELPEDFMKTYFQTYKSLKFTTKGNAVRVIGCKQIKDILFLPQDICKKTGLGPKHYFALSLRGKTLWLKRLDIVEKESSLPGLYIFDHYLENRVIRYMYSSTSKNPSLENISFPITQLNCDALPHFKEMGGYLGYISRKKLFQELSFEDYAFIEEQVDYYRSKQSDKGDWDSNLVLTACNILRLYDYKRDKSEYFIKKACEWILSTPEPYGLPGMFMGSLGLVEDFNRWKSDKNVKKFTEFYRKRRHFKKHEHVQSAFRNNQDLVPIFCEFSLISSTAIVLKSLIRAGYMNHPRVKKAIISLFKCWIHREELSKCLKHDFSIEESPNEDLRTILSSEMDLFKELQRDKDISQIYKIIQITGKHRFVYLNKTLSFYQKIPLYSPESIFTLEVYDSLHCFSGIEKSSLKIRALIALWNLQDSLGGFGFIPFSVAFSFLKKLNHPLARFMLYRTFPLLKRVQDEEGFWDDEELFLYWDEIDAPFGTYRLDPEICTYRILAVLNAHSLLNKNF